MTTLLQVASSNIGSSLLILLIISGASLAIFLVLWYWKVDKILNNQQIQINQQYEIINQLSQIAEINLKKDRDPNISYKSNS